MGLHDDSEETRRIGVWDERSGRKVIEISAEQYALLRELLIRKFDPRRSHEVASMIPLISPERCRPLGITVAQCKLTVNAIYMAYAIVCKSSKSRDDLNTHLAACLAQDPTLAVIEALDILRAGIERGEWFEEN